MNAEVGTKVAEARRLMETDPQKAIDLLQQQLTAVQAAGLSEPVTRTMVRRLEVAIELAKKDKVVFDEKMQDKNYREEIERKRLRILEADKAKKDRLKEFMDKAMEAQANDNWVEAEKYARLAAEIDPERDRRHRPGHQGPDHAALQPRQAAPRRPGRDLPERHAGRRAPRASSRQT